MPPTENLDGNTLDLPNPIEDTLSDDIPFITPIVSASSQDIQNGQLLNQAAETMVRLDLTPSPQQSDASSWSWTQGENSKKEPVSLLKYIPKEESNTFYQDKNNIVLPVLTPISDFDTTKTTLPLYIESHLMDNQITKKSSGLPPPYPTVFQEKEQSVMDGNGSLSHASSISIPTNNSSACLVPDPNNFDKLEPESTENLRTMTMQVFIPYLIAGFGMVGAGLVLDKVQHWEVFKVVKAIYIVVPPLLGLKGNLEMTLASRLSTLTNMGSMDTKKAKLSFIGGNMIISQCLASLIGFLTSLVAVLISSIEHSSFNLDHSLLLVASSVATAAASSCILDSIMVSVILLSRKIGINPDNVATPIAASLGDITTIGLLAGISALIYKGLDQVRWIAPLVTLSFLILVPLWIYLASRNDYTAKALKTTALPVFFAMLISTGGGFILNIAVSRFADIVVFQPIINGVGGNLVAIQASRIATSLHRETVLGCLPSSHPNFCSSPISVFFGCDAHARCVRVLMMMVVPGHLIFIYMTSYISTGTAALSFPFVCVYIIAAMLQVAILLYIASIITYLGWMFKVDPDNFTIPLMTALGDLLGIGLLYIAFLILELFGERVQFINPFSNN